MKKLTNPIHYRELLIAALVCIIMLVLGSFFDLRLSKAVYDPINTNYFGIIMSGISEIPCYLGAVFAGTALIVARDKTSKIKTVFSFIVGILAIGVATYFGVDTFRNIAEFKSTEHLSTLILVLGIILIACLTSGIIILTIIKGKKIQRDLLFRVAVLLLAIIIIELILATGLKFVFSRPRPRYLLSPDFEGTIEESFRNWWSASPFECLKLKPSDNFKSFPSGHSASSFVCVALFPALSLLFKNTRNDRKLQVALFYAGFGWALLTAVSRIYAGAHFLSDTAGGFLLTLIVIVPTLYVIFTNMAPINIEQ